ncbi:MAG TPA: bile acid:sodium symporter family protein, partial [Pseudomonadales bacterium]|nr:bile acid:sodium symporter family protein [Pseudomonadales bacterium]
NFYANAFPLWALLCAALAFWNPTLFSWFSGPWITYGLGIIMLGMGITLTLDDFKRIAQFPSWVLAGIFLHYCIMPFTGWTLAKLFDLPDAFAVGLILVACCPAGTASNVINYLAGGNVALSVTITTLSTIVAIALTPLLTELLAGSRMEVDGWGLFQSCLEVVLFPLALGLILKRFLPRFSQQFTRVSPAIAVSVIALIIASVLSSGHQQVIRSGPKLIGAVVLLHCIGFALGYGLSWLINRNKTVARTVCIEVGLQNSGLGAMLARKHFPAGSGVDVPSALSALIQSLLGSLLAAIWRKFPSQD